MAHRNQISNTASPTLEAEGGEEVGELSFMTLLTRTPQALSTSQCAAGSHPYGQRKYSQHAIHPAAASSRLAQVERYSSPKNRELLLMCDSRFPWLCSHTQVVDNVDAIEDEQRIELCRIYGAGRRPICAAIKVSSHRQNGGGHAFVRTLPRSPGS